MKNFVFILFSFLIFFNYKVYSTAETEIDNFLVSGVMNGVFPGAQLLIAKNNESVYNKSIGFYTYDEDAPEVTKNSMYDIASLTKVVATTPAIMKLYENKQLDIYDRVSLYLPEFAQNGKDEITILNLLIHNSGLKAWIPFYKTCSNEQDVLKTIYEIGLDYSTGSKTVYSDLNAIILGEIVKKVSGKNLQDYCRDNIFEPLGMNHTMFNPTGEFKKLCVPTEYDGNWRMKQLKGEVHDEAAYLMGGISGNAGLFSTSSDLYKYMSALINKGNYYNPYTKNLKQEKLFLESTVSLFTKKISDLNYYNTRALGWDTKPEPTSSRVPCGEMMSDNCFGHTGYTGTSIWYDKDKDILIIFLTNRVYPDRSNTTIREFRPDLHNKILSLY